MASIELSDAYERHEYLPTAINWLGTWDSNVVYFKNDIATSPINTGSYIMVGDSTTIQGGGDPSIDSVNWYPYGFSITSLQSITAENGLELTGSTTNPSLQNTGVISLTPGVGFSNVGSAQDPILDCETLTAITPGFGINVFGLPVPNIVNTGVVSLFPVNDGVGVFTDQNGQATITNTGVLTVSPGNSGISVNSGFVTTITNNGLLTLNAGTGILNTGTAIAPNFANNGVVSITPLNHSITVNGTTTVTISSNNPKKTAVWTPTSNTAMIPPIAQINVNNPSGIGEIALTQVAGSLWETCLATGTPYSSGIFTLTIPFTFYIGYSFIGAGFPFIYYLYDSTTNTSFKGTYFIYQGDFQPDSTKKFNRFTIGTIYIDLAKLRASGFRRLTSFRMQGTQSTIAGISLQNVGSTAFATFYPSSG